MVTDSAAASSAWGGGQRVNNGSINVDFSGKEVTPIAAILKKNCNARIGLVTTATVTHATPAGFAASISSRGNENSIAPQYLNRVDVILADDPPFLLQVEGARVDHAAHLNDIAGLLGDQLAFDDALAAMLAMIAGRDDILIVVTSDHGNANPGLNGMVKNSEVFGHMMAIFG